MRIPVHRSRGAAVIRGGVGNNAPGGIMRRFLLSRPGSTLLLTILSFICGYMYAIRSMDYLYSKSNASNYYYQDSLSLISTTHSTTLSSSNVTATISNNKKNDKGWKSIDVFYGTTDHLDITGGQTNNITNRTWFSQAHQDELITGLLRHKRRGYFIDLAANDAVELSNSLALERYFEWNGLCIEPNALYWKNLAYRQCQTVGAVVGNQRDETVYFRFEAKEHGGIAGDGFDNGKRWQRNSVPQSTVTLQEIFERYNVPHEIDYLSLDVEGAESFIMMAFPLQDYRIRLITAERLRGPIREFLKNHSYEHVSRLTRWGETLWVHTDYKDEMDWNVMNKFSFPY